MTDKKQRFSPARLKKRLLPFLFLAGLPMFFLFGEHHFLSFSRLTETYVTLKALVDGKLATASLIFGAAYVVTVALSLPIASLLTVVGGALFGWTGAAIIICAATIGATIVFIAVRTALYEFFVKRTSGFMAKLEAGFQKNAFFYLLALRLIPVAPFWVVNIVPGLLGMRLNHYMLATFIGITPGTLIYVWFARGFDSLLSRGQRPDLSALSEPAIIVPLFALGLLSLMPVFWKPLQVRQQTFASDNAHDDVNNG